jgi:hypothetical protein
LSALLLQASQDLCNLNEARCGYTSALNYIPDLPALPERLRAVAFALLDAAGWPPGAVRSSWAHECASERYALAPPTNAVEEESWIG